jgi:hypothetical protein
MSDSRLLEAQSHTICLCNAALITLNTMLKASGWAGDEKDFKRSRKAQKIIKPVLPDEPKVANAEWDIAPAPTFELNEKLRDTCKKCVQHFFAAKALLNTDVAENLLLQFGVIDGEEE